MLLEDYDEYSAIKRLIWEMKCTEGWKFAMNQEEVMNVTNYSNVFLFEILKAWNYSLNNIVESKYEWNFLLAMNKWGPIESPIKSLV